MAMLNKCELLRGFRGAKKKTQAGANERRLALWSVARVFLYSEEQFRSVLVRR